MVLTWNFLINFDFDKPLPNFRSEKTLLEYTKFKGKNYDINNYIYSKYLENTNYSLQENDFPYETESNMKHYVLWINKSFEKNISQNLLKCIIKQKMIELNFDDFLFFENHTSIKTIPGILHYQVFFKKTYIF